MRKFNFRRCGWLFLVVFLVGVCFVYSQQGVQKFSDALSEGTGSLKKVFKVVSTFLYVLAGIIGLVGGFKVYSKYQNQEQDAQKSLITLAGGVVAIIVISFLMNKIFIQ